MNHFRAVLALGLFIATCAIAPFALAAGDPTVGNTLYQANCSGCHGASADLNHVIRGANDPDQISAAIQGQPDMKIIPALKALTFAQLTDIAAYLQAVKTGSVASPNYQGLWWATGGTEDGWGINFAHQGDRVFATWYTYDTSGNAYWLSMLADRTSATSNAYSGTINSNVGSPFDNYTGNSPADPVGTGILTFSDVDNGTFDYTITSAGGATNVHQVKPITRYFLTSGPRVVCQYNATADPTTATNYQDLWWVPAESGWGVNFAHEGTLIFFTWYTYGANNAPMWLSGLLKSDADPTRFTADLPIGLYKSSGPRFDNYRHSDERVDFVGTVTLTFLNGNRANFTYTTIPGHGLAAVTQTKVITRIQFAPGATICQ